MSSYSPASQPRAGLADVLNPAEEQRDSAYFSSSSGEHSKHTSQASCQTQSAMFSPTNSSYPSSLTENTPSPTSQPHHPPHTLTPSTSTAMTVASMVSPTTPTSIDTNMLAKLGRPGYSESQRCSTVSEDERARRESVESRNNLGLGIEQMKIAATNSPYASNNQSTTSLQSTLQQQRNPGVPADRLSGSRFPSTYQPNSQRFSGSSQKQSRTAPTITGPANSAVAHAAEPTKGQPWAFPDEPDQRVQTAPGPLRDPDSRQTSFIGSRRSSAADSIASSQYTTESHLPPGQRRLEDGYATTEYNRLSRASSEFQGASHHHHQLQNKQISDLRNEEGGSPNNSQPYSRTPELRAQHKLAERKRRNEMKELYEELRNLLPQDRVAKPSKWEILSKAIAQHKQQEELINQLSEHYRRAQEDLIISRRDTEELKQEIRQLRQEFANLASQTSQPIPPSLIPLSTQPPSSLEPYQTGSFPRPVPRRPEPRPELPLPPLRSLNTPLHPPPESMTGVQYQVERPPNVNGYRPGYASHA